jgi:hypothetical protein
MRITDRTIIAAGGVHDLLLIQGEGHGFDNWSSDQLNAAWARVRAFPARYALLR